MDLFEMSSHIGVARFPFTPTVLSFADLAILKQDTTFVDLKRVKGALGKANSEYTYLVTLRVNFCRSKILPALGCKST